MNIKKWFVPLGFSRRDEDVEDEEYKRQDFEESLALSRCEEKGAGKFDYKFNEIDYIITLMGILSLPFTISMMGFLN